MVVLVVFVVFSLSLIEGKRGVFLGSCLKYKSNQKHDDFHDIMYLCFKSSSVTLCQESELISFARA